MKMNKLLTLPLIACGLVSCSNGIHGVKTLALYGVDEKQDVSALSEVDLMFFESEEIPYISVIGGFQLLSGVRSINLEDQNAKYSYSGDIDKLIIKDELGNSAIFDSKEQTITFSDYDAFICGYKGTFYPRAIAAPNETTKAYRVVTSESSYKKGHEVVLKLNDYASLKMRKDNDILYVPLVVMSDILAGGVNGFTGLTYNFKNPYLTFAGLKDLNGSDLSKLGTKYYEDAPKKKTISKELAEFTYDEMMFNMDYFYGLKSYKNVDSFKNLAKTNNLEGDMLSGDIEKMDAAYGSLLLKCLDDGHTTPFLPSVFSNPSEYHVEVEWKSDKQKSHDKEEEALTDKRKETKTTRPVEIVGDTAYIYFDSFDDFDETVLYGDYDEDTIKNHNYALFAYAYKEIKKDSDVKNIVVDLVTNGGGDAGSLVFCLGTLLGKFYIDSGNPLSGSYTHVTYEVDVNTDGKIDENDVPLINDYNIYMLDSKFAFSCGNLFPVAAQYNNSKIKAIGDRTGGGCCAIKTSYNAIGATNLSSGLTMLYRKDNDKYVPIEDGAKVDIPLNYDKMFDREYINTLLK